MVSFVAQDITQFGIALCHVFIASHSSMLTHFPLQGGHGISLSLHDPFAF